MTDLETKLTELGRKIFVMWKKNMFVDVLIVKNPVNGILNIKFSEKLLCTIYAEKKFFDNRLKNACHAYIPIYPITKHTIDQFD